MGLKKLAAKVAEYNARLEQGKAREIKPSHVRKALSKLQQKAAELETDLAATTDKDRRARLERKLRIAREHVARAEWLLKEIEKRSETT